MELAGIDGAAAKWDKAVEIALLAEQLGYDSIWVYDHFHNVPRPAHEAVFECWTTMAAISQLTSTIRLGQMVGCNSYRNPALLAKITSTVDVISGGRLDWGIGAGWYELEYRGYGYEFPKPKDRIGMLRETVEIVTSMWTRAGDDVQGRALRAVAGELRPEAAAGPAPAGLDRRRRRAADAARRRPPRRLLELRRQPRAVGAQARRAAGPLRRRRPRPGRDPHDVVAGGVHPRRPRPRSLAAGTRSLWGEPAETWRAGNLVGTPEQVAEKVRAYVDLGCARLHPVVRRLPRHRDPGRCSPAGDARRSASGQDPLR